MSVRIRNRIVVVASTDTDEKVVQFERQDTTLTTVTATYDCEMSGELILAASEVNYTIPLGKVVRGRFLYLESDQELTIKLEGEAVGHKISPSTATKAKIFLHSNFTVAPIITNLSTVEANVAYIIAGDKS